MGSELKLCNYPAPVFVVVVVVVVVVIFPFFNIFVSPSPHL